MAQPPLLQLQAIRLTFGGTPLLTEADLSVAPRERIGLVGRNGSGKSTFLKIAAGLIEADAGTRFLQPGVTVRYLAQEPDLSAFATVREAVQAGLGPADNPYAVDATIEGLALDPDRPIASLSGGEARRAALAQVIAPDPDILFLDEPTNHLDIEGIEALETLLSERRKAFVLISHDRAFLEALTTATVWIDRGITRRREISFAGFEDWRDEVFEAEATERDRLDTKIALETRWLHRGVTARRRRNMGRLRALQDMRKERRELRAAAGEVKLAASTSGPSGKLVAEAKGITKAFDGRPVVRDLSIRIERGDRVGLVGQNGAGKTTLLNLLLGRLAPDAGTVRLGTNLDVAFLDQRRASLDPTDTLREAVTGGGSDTITVGGATKHVAGYLQDFLFSPEQFNTPLSALSGGERARVTLARAFAQPSNLLVLDEPTNDLDLETLDLLAELVADYQGTVLLVSHDRDFLDRTVTSVIHAEGDGRWVEYAGGYSDMRAQRALGARNAEPQGRSAGAKRPVAGEPRSTEAKATSEPAKGRGKMSYKDKFELEALPERIATLERDRAKWEAVLSDAGLFARDPKTFDHATASLSRVLAELDAAETRWLELEALKEALGAG